MPKKKTKKAAAKRFKISKRGKVLYRHAGRGHLLTGKSRNRKRHLRKKGVLCDLEARRIRGLLSV